MSFDWTQYKQAGDWISFHEIGDHVVGTIVAIRVGTDFGGNPCPELVLDVDGEEKTLTAGQVMLKAALAEQAPQVGDKIRIVYSGNGDPKPGRSPAKLFEVAVKAADPGSHPLPAAGKKIVNPDEVPF